MATVRQHSADLVLVHHITSPPALAADLCSINDNSVPRIGLTGLTITEYESIQVWNNGDIEKIVGSENIDQIYFKTLLIRPFESCKSMIITCKVLAHSCKLHHQVIWSCSGVSGGARGGHSLCSFISHSENTRSLLVMVR